MLSYSPLASEKSKDGLPTQNVVGFQISTLSFEKQVTTITAWAKARASKIVCVANVHMLMEGQWSHEFSKILAQADLLTPDGMPLVWMTRILNRRKQERVAGLELMQALCQSSAESDVGIFLLGSTEAALSNIQQRLSQEFPRLKIAGVLSPPFRELSDVEELDIVTQINNSGAGLVLVALGCPKQEKWMNRNRPKIQATMVGLGGAFPVYAGLQRWAPVWVRAMGLEWLYRLIQEPRRLWRRYAQTIPPFIYLALKQVFKASLGISPDISIRKKCLEKCLR